MSNFETVQDAMYILADVAIAYLRANGVGEAEVGIETDDGSKWRVIVERLDDGQD